MNNVKETILKAFNFRYACKEFDPTKKISEADFNFILETGRLSPSSFGFEPWRFLVVQNQELRNKIKEFAWGAQKQLPSASHFVILLARKEIDTKAGSEYTTNIMEKVQKLPLEIVKMKSEFYSNFQNKDFDLTDERKLFDWASKQTYIPLANMMTSAAQIGIDSCPIEGFDRNKINEILAEEGLIDSNHFSASVMVAFGYRSQTTNVPVKTRQEINDIAKWIL